MNIFCDEENIRFNENENHNGGELIGIKNGALNGFCMGISIYLSEEYGKPGIHEDQEGFYVIQGNGYAKVGNEEFEIFPGRSFIVSAGIPHSVKNKKNSEPVKLLWIHGAI